MKKLLFLIVLYSLPVFVHSQVSWKKDDYLRDPRIAGDMEFRFWLMGVTPQTTGQTVEALLKRWPELKILPGDTLAPDVFNELVLEFSNPVSNNQITEWMDRFRQEAAVKFISPALKLGKNRDEGYSFLRNRIMLFLKQNIQLADVQPIFQTYGVTLLEELSLAPGRSFLVEVAKTSSYDALSVQNIWQNMPQFEIVCADFRSFTNFGNTTYQDPKRNDQRNIHNVKPTSSSNRQAEDMDVLRAWQISTGSTFHEVAILDDGLQFNHPDLSGNFSMGYDFYLGLSGNFPSIFNSSPSFYSRHGTGCAGVAFAKKNVLGGVGVAPNGRGVGYRIANKTK